LSTLDLETPDDVYDNRLNNQRIPEDAAALTIDEIPSALQDDIRQLAEEYGYAL